MLGIPRDGTGAVFENGAIFQPLAVSGTEVTTADVDGDSQVDVLVSHASTGTVSLLRGNGDGTLQFAEEDSAGAGCGPMAAGDLNADGHSDLVVTNRGATTLSVMMASFGGLVSGTVTLPGPPIQAQLADLDHDGVLDVIVALASPLSLGWLRGHGDGLFDPFATLAPIAGGVPRQLEVADLDLDGNADALVLLSSNAVAIGLGNGSGGIGPLTLYPFPSPGPGRFQPESGPMRLRHRSDGTSEVWVFAPNVLQVPGGFPVVPPRFFIAAGSPPAASFQFGEYLNTDLLGSSNFRLLELSGDERTDVVMGSTIHVDWAFLPVWPQSQTFGGAGMTAADLNGDSHPDLIGLTCQAVTVALLEPVNEYTIASGAGASYFGPNQAPFAFADLDGDAHVDAAALSQNQLWFWHGATDGTFSAAQQTSVGAALDVLEPGDVNGDGRLDLVGFAAAAPAQLVVVPNTTAGFGAPIVSSSTDFVASLVVGDLNRDGRSDVVARSQLNRLMVFLANPDGSLSQGAAYASGAGLADVQLGDLDGDGNLDAVTAHQGANTVAFWRGGGDGTFGPPLDNAVAGPQRVGIADLDGDGDLDVCVATPSGLFSLLGTGGGTLGTPIPALPGVTLALNTGLSSLRLQDVDLDGRVDALLLRSLETCTPLQVARGRGDGSFQLEETYARGQPRVVTAYPLDPGGAPDLLFSTASGFSVLRGLGPMHVITASAGPGGTISPSGLVQTKAGADRTFRITAFAGHSIGDVVVDGASVGAVATYTFPQVAADHAIAASFLREVELEFDLAIDRLMLGKPHMDHSVPAYIEPTPPDTPADLVASSIRLNNAVAIDPSFAPVVADHDRDGRPELEVQFLRSDLDAVLPTGDAVPVTVAGRITGGVFHGSDVVEVRRPKVPAPHGAEVVAAGSPYQVQYEVVPGVEWVALLHTLDDGATWVTDVTEQENDGTILWQVPVAVSDRARVAIAQVESGPVGDPEPLGVLAVSDLFAIGGPVGVGQIPATLQLSRVVPTPSRGSMRLVFGLPRPAHVTLDLTDVAGRRVAGLVDRQLEAGWHDVTWRGEAAAGGRVAAGVYVVRLRAEGIEQRRKVTWMR